MTILQGSILLAPPPPEHIPEGEFIKVLLRPDFLGKPVNNVSATVFYLDGYKGDEPLVNRSVTMVKRMGKFAKNTETFGQYLGVEMPVGDTVFFVECAEANLNEYTARFTVRGDLESEAPSAAVFLDELLAAYAQTNP